jgi:hypothetical protein
MACRGQGIHYIREGIFHHQGGSFEAPLRQMPNEKAGRCPVSPLRISSL